MSPINLQSLSSEAKKKFIDSFDTIVSDCDGVIWNPRGVINHANQAVDKLIKAGKKIFFITNNSTRTNAQLVAKFKELGFTNVTEDCVITTASLAANYLRDKLSPGKTVYVIGPPSVCEELSKYNIPCFGVGKDDMTEDFWECLNTAQLEIRENVGAVLIGFDIFLSYSKIVKGANYLKNKDCLFVVTNTDETFPSGCGLVVPGAGAIVAPIKVASGREPFLLGKPSTYLGEMLKDKVNPQRTLFIGDRLNTDILMGRRCDFKTLLVLSGIHNLDDIEKFAKSENVEERNSVPDYYISTFSDLL